MKKFTAALITAFSLMAMTSSVFAQSTELNSWEATKALKNGDYYKITAPVEYDNIQITSTNTECNSWNAIKASKNGDY